MAAISAELNLEISRFRRSINRANQMMSRFAGKGEKHGRSHGKGFSKGFRFEFTKMIGKLGALAGISSAGFLLGKQFMASMKDAANRERFEVGVAALTGDPDVGDEFFAHLRAEAMRTGADIQDLAIQTRRMIGMGLSPTEAKKLTASILDIGGSLALTNDETKRLTVGLLQVKSKGVASMEELRQQIAEKGVPIFEAMQEAFKFDVPTDLFKAIEQGLVPAEAVLDIFINLTGAFEGFRGGADKMAQTLGGAFNVMVASFRDMRIEFSHPIADTIRPILREITEILQGLTDESGFFGDKVAQGIGLMHSALTELSSGELLSLLGDGLKIAFLGALVAVEDGLTKIFSLLLEPGFWATFEQKFQVVALGFGATLIDGMMKAAGLEIAQEPTILTAEQRRADPNAPIFGTRDINRMQQALREGDFDRASGSAFAKKMTDSIANRRQVLEDLKEGMAETLFDLNEARIVRVRSERIRSRKLREGPEKEKVIQAHDELAPLIPVDANGRPIRRSTLVEESGRFSGLSNLRALQSRNRIEGSDFGTGFKGVSQIGGAAGTGGAAAGRKGQVSLEDAVEFLFGENRFKDEKKANNLREKIEAHMREIKDKDPIKVIRQLGRPAFQGT